MKIILKTSITILGVLAAVSIMAQIPVNPNKTDAQGKRQGKWTILYDKDKPITDTATMVFYRLINYLDDKPVGVIRNIRKNGKLLSTASMVQDRPKPIWTGLVTFFNDDGIKEAEMLYDNGASVGEALIYYTDGTIIQPDSLQYLTTTGISLKGEAGVA